MNRVSRPIFREYHQIRVVAGFVEDVQRAQKLGARPVTHALVNALTSACYGHINSSVRRPAAVMMVEEVSIDV